MPRVSRLRRATRYGGNGATRYGGNDAAPPPLTDAAPSTQATPFIEATSQAPPVAQIRPHRRRCTEAPSQDSPATQTRLRRRQYTEAPLEGPPTPQTRHRHRQYAEAPSQDPPRSTDAQACTQASLPPIGSPSCSQVPPPLINATPSTEVPSQAPPAIQVRQSRYSQCTKPTSEPQPSSSDALPHSQVPPSSTATQSSSEAPTTTNARSSTRASISLIDATPSAEIPFQSLPVTQSAPSMEPPSQAIPVTQTQPKGRQSTRHWTVDVKDASGVAKVAHLKLKDLWELPDGTKVVLPLNDCKQPVGEAGGLLGQALGELGADFTALPICYKSWLKVPSSYKEVVYNSKIEEKFIINDPLVKKIIIKRIGEKWKDNRSEVFHRYYDPELSREENYSNHPSNVNRDQWIQFLEYRLDPKTVKMCQRNAQSREKLLVVHRGGSKTLARKRYEMEVEGGEPVSRGKLFIATHVGTDGSCVNDATRTICDKITQVENEGSCSQEIGPNDSLGQVLGKEHPGRLRGMGLGPCKSQVAGGGTQMRMHDEDDPNSCLNSASFAQMQQEIVDLRAQLESETKNRLEFQNALTLVLQHLSNSNQFMTPGPGAILNPILASYTSDGDVGPGNGSSDDAF